MNKKTLEERVVEAAEKVLLQQRYVSSIDVLIAIGYLQFVHVEDWRRGRVPYLEQVIYINLEKISAAMKCLRRWATDKGLKPSETIYLARTSGPKRQLQFSKSGDPNIELAYRTNYVSPELSAKKSERIKEKLEKQPENVVFWLINDAQCAKCKKELSKGNFLIKEVDSVLCLDCAGFADLVFMPAGNAKLTRRAKQYSKTYAVVVKFSRARKRYERQGLLVQKDALAKAEGEVGVQT